MRKCSIEFLFLFISCQIEKLIRFLFIDISIYLFLTEKRMYHKKVGEKDEQCKKEFYV